MVYVWDQTPITEIITGEEINSRFGITNMLFGEFDEDYNDNNRASVLTSRINEKVNEKQKEKEIETGGDAHRCQ